MGEELRIADDFARELANAFGEALRSIVLYGSAARDEYQEGLSDLNLLVILREVDAASLRRASPLARRWVEAGNPPPLIIGHSELLRSLDTFPIEYAEIRDAHRVLEGENPVAELRIDREHLRLQCEHELKGKRIQLRERYLLTADDPEALGELLVRSISTFLVLFRTVLRLAGKRTAGSPEQIVRATAEQVGFNPKPLLAILRARADRSGLRPAPEDEVVLGYLAAIDQTVQWVDGLSAGSSPGNSLSSS